MLDLSMGRNRKQRVTVELDGDIGDTFDKLHDADIEITIRKYRRRRSLDANAYAWVLIDRIAEELGLPKETIYRQTVREIGGVSELICLKNEAVERFRATWESNGIGWPTVVMPSRIPGCSVVVAYYGSSTYNTKQMHDLIDLLIRDCDELGIEHMTPEELARLEEMEKRYAKPSDKGIDQDKRRD